MVELDLELILETTDTIVQELLATGEFGHCTFKDVLFRLDTRLEFPRGTLLRYEHKSTVKELIKELVLRADGKDEQILSPPPKKRSARPEPEAGRKSTKRRKTKVEASDQEGSNDEPESKKAKKSGSTSKVKEKGVKAEKSFKSKRKKPSVKSTASGKAPKSPISAELVDSDLDDTDPGPSTSKPPASTSPPKKSKQRIADSDDGEGDTVGTLQPTKPQTLQKRPNAERIPEAKRAPGDKSDSEISVLFDEEPPKRRRAKGVKDETKPKGTRQKKEKKNLSKDEETIKRLKSLVVACGVRKVWSKEFKDLDSPSAQIKRLKSILAELGMSGRMSVEQAKAIKAKREFAQELEDVKDFEKKVVGRSEGRSSRKKLGSGGRNVESSDEDEDEDDDDEDDKPRKKRTNARNSISAFLKDQSDED